MDNAGPAGPLATEMLLDLFVQVYLTLQELVGIVAMPHVARMRTVGGTFTQTNKRHPKTTKRSEPTSRRHAALCSSAWLAASKRLYSQFPVHAHFALELKMHALQGGLVQALDLAKGGIGQGPTGLTHVWHHLAHVAPKRTGHTDPNIFRSSSAKRYRSRWRLE